jgi:hypothetical protein
MIIAFSSPPRLRKSIYRAQTRYLIHEKYFVSKLRLYWLIFSPPTFPIRGKDSKKDQTRAIKKNYVFITSISLPLPIFLSKTMPSGHVNNILTFCMVSNFGICSRIFCTTIIFYCILFELKNKKNKK